MEISKKTNTINNSAFNGCVFAKSCFEKRILIKGINWLVIPASATLYLEFYIYICVYSLRGMFLDAFRLMLRGLSCYSPHFGSAFYDGSWQEGFDRAKTFQQITCPTFLLHANFEINEAGLLNGLYQEEAYEHLRLILNSEYMKIYARHFIHLEEPDQFVQIMREFFLSDA